ncbi:MAG: glycosyltransferase family 1 protein [Planctomycetia bacterium]|jgi:glycosyltransferase involved in cell wall biosynthesis
MRIILFAHNLKMAGGLSVGKNLIGAMLQVAPMHQYLIVIPAEADYPDYAEQKNVEVLKCPSMSLLKRQIWERGTLRKTISKFAPDWIWALGNIPVPNIPCRQTLLIQNSTFVYSDKEVGVTPSLKTRFRLWQSTRLIRNGLKNLDHVQCQTEVMRRRFSKTFRFPYEQTRLCRTPISPCFFDDHVAREPEIFKTYADRFKIIYITFGSGGGGHKNLDRIVDMYSRYREKLSKTVCFLTIDKTMNDLSRSICDRIEKENLDDLIVLLGAIPFEEIRDYYHSADALFFPSRLETIGLPQWEAMASGLPVIASDLDFAHEVCGDAAVFVDPFSITSMKDGILKMASDESLRKDLIHKGYAQLEKIVHSWPDSVRQVLHEEKIEHLQA